MDCFTLPAFPIKVSPQSFTDLLSHSGTSQETSLPKPQLFPRSWALQRCFLLLAMAVTVAQGCGSGCAGGAGQDRVPGCSGWRQGAGGSLSIPAETGACRCNPWVPGVPVLSLHCTDTLSLSQPLQDLCHSRGCIYPTFDAVLFSNSSLWDLVAFI